MAEAWSVTEFALSSSARVPLRRQLAVQLAAAIRSGSIREGQRLPSARKLARDLGIHRNTVFSAYKELHGLGLVRRVPRTGVYAGCSRFGSSASAAGVDRVGREHSTAGDKSLEGELDRFLRSQRRCGRSARELDRLMARWVPRSAEPRILVVEPEPGLRRLLAAEIARCLPEVRIEGCTAGRVRRDPERHAGWCIVARADVAAVLSEHDPATTDLHILRTSSPLGCRRAIRALQAGQVVSLLTVSRGLRRHVRELFAGDLGGRIGLFCPRPDRPQEISLALRISSLVLTDLLVWRLHSAVAGAPPGSPARLVRVVQPGWIHDLARYLGVDCEGSASGERAITSCCRRRNEALRRELEAPRGIG